MGRTGLILAVQAETAQRLAQNVEEDRRDDEGKRGVEQAARCLGKHGHLNRGGIDVRGGEAQLDVGFEQVERGIGQRAEHAARR